jgi:DNA-directed RNA polymerase specialized sigma24 family protein
MNCFAAHKQRHWPGTSKWNKIEHRLFSHIAMNWRGRPLASHEVIVNTIAATTTRTGLRVRAELDTSGYDTGVKISDRQMEALPLTRHDWHGDWNYTLHPRDYDQAAGVPDPFDQPSPDLAWLCHPALTGLPEQDWDALMAALMMLHDQQRETNLGKRRGHRPRLTAPGAGRRPVLTLADRLLATVLHQRLALPQVAIAALFGVRPETINKRIRDIRQLLDQARYAIEPSSHHLTSLDDLYQLSVAADIVIPSEIKAAC